MKRKIIITGVQQTATAASKKAKVVKTASAPAMGSLSGHITESLEAFNTLESHVDKIGEKIEDVQFAVDGEKWSLTPAAVKDATATIKALAKANKTITVALAKAAKLADTLSAQVTKGRVVAAEPEAEEESVEEE